MNEENTVILPSEEQAEQNDRDTRAEELESTFRMMDIRSCEKSCLLIFVTPPS